MTLPEGHVADQPFPGAQSQVRGNFAEHSDGPSQDAVVGQSLPLEVRFESPGPAQGWQARLPVRAEAVTITKELVVYERAVVRRGQVRDVQHFEASVKQERLKVEVDD